MAISNSLKTRESLSEIVISEIFSRVRDLEDTGEYELATAVLGDWWQGVGVRPRDVDSLPEPERAQVLALAGSLTSWLGSREQQPQAQEAAKNLISEAVDLFERT